MSKSKKLVAGEQKDDLLFLNNSSQWPNWPICPVKRYVPGVKNAVVGVVFDGAPIVYEVNMYFIGVSKSVEDVPKHKYESLVELVADGWMVD